MSYKRPFDEQTSSQPNVKRLSTKNDILKQTYEYTLKKLNLDCSKIMKELEDTTMDNDIVAVRNKFNDYKTKMEEIAMYEKKLSSLDDNEYVDITDQQGGNEYPVIPIITENNDEEESLRMMLKNSMHSKNKSNESNGESKAISNEVRKSNESNAIIDEVHKKDVRTVINSSENKNSEYTLQNYLDTINYYTNIYSTPVYKKKNSDDSVFTEKTSVCMIPNDRIKDYAKMLYDLNVSNKTIIENLEKDNFMLDFNFDPKLKPLIVELFNVIYSNIRITRINDTVNAIIKHRSGLCDYVCKNFISKYSDDCILEMLIYTKDYNKKDEIIVLKPKMIPIYIKNWYCGNILKDYIITNINYIHNKKMNVLCTTNDTTMKQSYIYILYDLIKYSANNINISFNNNSIITFNLKMIMSIINSDINLKKDKNYKLMVDRLLHICMKNKNYKSCIDILQKLCIDIANEYFIYYVYCASNCDVRLSDGYYSNKYLYYAFKYYHLDGYKYVSCLNTYICDYIKIVKSFDDDEIRIMLMNRDILNKIQYDFLNVLNINIFHYISMFKGDLETLKYIIHNYRFPSKDAYNRTIDYVIHAGLSSIL